MRNTVEFWTFERIYEYNNKEILCEQWNRIQEMEWMRNHFLLQNKHNNSYRFLQTYVIDMAGQS